MAVASVTAAILALASMTFASASMTFASAFLAFTASAFLAFTASAFLAFALIAFAAAARDGLAGRFAQEQLAASGTEVAEVEHVFERARFGIERAVADPPECPSCPRRSAGSRSGR